MYNAQEKQAGGAAAAAEATDAEVAVFLVRHGQRIDETPAGVAWRRQTDRWFDPPLTDEGREQAASAAAQLGCFMAAHAAEYAPFSRVYASPLLRTLHTAEQFGIALSLPVAPVPGLATCTAAFKRHGPDANPLLREQRAREECPGAAMEPFDAAYEVPPRDADGGGGGGGDGGDGGGGDGAERDPFVAAVVVLAQREAAARSAAGGAAQKAAKAAVLVVTHREGLRDLSQRTAAPFVKTKYCCVGVFGCALAGGGGAAAVARGAGSGATFSLVHAPEQFEALAVDLPGAGGGAAEVVDAFAEGEENTQAPRRIAHDGGRYTRAQFVQYYGGTAEWDAASDAPVVVVDDRADSAKKKLLSNQCEVM